MSHLKIGFLSFLQQLFQLPTVVTLHFSMVTSEALMRAINYSTDGKIVPVLY